MDFGYPTRPAAMINPEWPECGSSMGRPDSHRILKRSLTNLGATEPDYADASIEVGCVFAVLGCLHPKWRTKSITTSITKHISQPMDWTSLKGVSDVR